MCKNESIFLFMLQRTRIKISYPRYTLYIMSEKAAAYDLLEFLPFKHTGCPRKIDTINLPVSTLEGALRLKSK